MQPQRDSDNPLGIPVPKMKDRVLFIGWGRDSEMFLKNQVPGLPPNQAFYATIGDIPWNEPEPDFLHINGEIVADDEIEALYIARAWDPAMVTVVGRLNSRFQTYAKVRGPWALLGSWCVAIAVLAALFFLLKSAVLGLFHR